MPTATTTTIAKGTLSAQIPLKAGLNSLSSPTMGSPTSPIAKTSTSATLRSLYNRAGRAFVLRDIPLTYSLIQSAFALLAPPGGLPDALADYRRKWDILRITFESTVYTSPPTSTETLPESLRAVLSEPAQSLVTSIYKRSLSLFTPSGGASNAAYLPSQVLTTLVYSSLKVDAADVGRVIIEDWLACRQPQYSLDAQEGSEGEGYAKIVDLYCIHILPKLEQWDYAKEFLEYENEMPTRKREHLKTSLNNLYMASRHRFQPPEALIASGPSSPRSYSPAPSSSSSSSLSTTSTGTIVPATPRGNPLSRGPSALTSFSSTAPSSSTTSVASDETATPQTTRTAAPANGTHISPRQRSKSRTVSSSASSAYGRTHLAHQVSSTTTATPPSIVALLRASLKPYLTRTRVTTFLVLFVLVPLISFVLRMRRRKLLLTAASGVTAATATAAASASTADLVRRRLGGASENGVFGRAWGEVVRVVGDTVRMAGSGLV